MLLGVMSAGEGMLIRPYLTAMGLVVTMVAVMSSLAPALASHGGTSATADMAAALVALMGFVEDLLVALNLLLRATKLHVLGVDLIVVRVMPDGGVMLDGSALCVTPVMEPLMTLHSVFSFKVRNLLKRALPRIIQLW